MVGEKGPVGLQIVGTEGPVALRLEQRGKREEHRRHDTVLKYGFGITRSVVHVAIDVTMLTKDSVWGKSCAPRGCKWHGATVGRSGRGKRSGCR